jgi:hypothetical protein
MAFDWTAVATAPQTPPPEAPRPAPAEASVPPAMPAAEPTTTPDSLPPGAPPPSAASPKLGAHGPALLARNRSLRATVERYLREQGVAYVNVEEAKEAIFAGAKLRSFHFVVYRPTGGNWLLWAAALRKGIREDLREWEQVFGDGFLAVVARQAKEGGLSFRTLAGHEVTMR